MLDSALAPPLDLVGYGDPSIVDLGARYAIALARNHPFVDGNKRAAYMAMVTFLDLNGARFEPPDAEAVIAMLDLASGASGDEGFTAWVAHYVRSDD